MLHAFGMNLARPARRWRKMFCRHERARGFARPSHGNRSRCFAYRPRHSNIGLAVSPGLSMALTVSADIFRPLHFVSSARKLSALTGKTSWPETAASCHYREECGASRPCQFSADSGQNKDHDPAGGRIFGRLSSPFLRPPSPHRCCSPVRHRAELGSEIKTRASAAPFPNRRFHGFCVR